MTEPKSTNGFEDWWASLDVFKLGVPTKSVARTIWQAAERNAMARATKEKRDVVSTIYLILGDAKYERYCQQITAAKEECEKTLFPKGLKL